VRHQLARFGAGRAEAHAVDDVVQARLEQRQQVRAGVALAALGFGEVAAELALQHAVHALDLLLLAQLQAEVAGARAGGAAMLAGLAVELGLVADGAAGALQEQVGAFTAGQFGLGSEVTCHVASFVNLTPACEARESGGCCCGRSDGGLQ
jgi:hypothetical protein